MSGWTIEFLFILSHYCCLQSLATNCSITWLQSVTMVNGMTYNLLIRIYSCAEIQYLISLYAFLSRFGILILNWNMLLNHYNISISLCFSASLLIISAVYEFTLGEYLAYCSLCITSFYRYICVEHQCCLW